MLQSQKLLQERYQLQQQLSNNPTRQTWLAEDTRTQQQVIVKLLPFSPQTQWQDVKLFEREAQTLEHLDLAEIPRYLDYFSIEKEAGGGLPWFALVQDYVSGSALQQLLKSGKIFSEGEVKNIAQQLLEILIHLHELSPPVLHRDIKPSNIIQGQDGKIHLVDFGAVQDKAKAEGVTFTVVGTGGYAPPEQLWGRAVAASDLYGLGATLIHLLTGVAPGELPQHRMRLQFRDKASLSPDFADWLDKLIDPAVEKRYGSAREALAALQATEVKETGVKVRYGSLGRLALLQYGVLGLCLLALPLFGVYRYITEGKNTVGSMNRAQQAYFLENNEFAPTLEDLQIGIKPQTQNYEYEIVKTPLFAMNYAIPRKRKFKGYVGIVIFDGAQTEYLTRAFVCEDDSMFASYLKHRMSDLSWIQGEVLGCPALTKSLSAKGEIFLKGENIKLAYQALDDVTPSGSTGDRSWQILAQISDLDVKAKALETIASYLKIEEDLAPALQLVETIEDREVRGRLLLTFAQKLQDNDKRAVQLRSRAFELLQPFVLREKNEYKLWLIQGTVGSLKTSQVQQVVEIARSTTRDDYKSEIVKAIAPSIGNNLLLEAALQIASEIQVSPGNDLPLREAFRAIATNLTTEQQIDRVLAFIPTLADDFQKSFVLQELAPSLKTEAQYNKALSLARRIDVNPTLRSRAIEAIEGAKRD